MKTEEPNVPFEQAVSEDETLDDRWQLDSFPSNYFLYVVLPTIFCGAAAVIYYNITGIFSFDIFEYTLIRF